MLEHVKRNPRAEVVDAKAFLGNGLQSEYALSQKCSITFGFRTSEALLVVKQADISRPSLKRTN